MIPLPTMWHQRRAPSNYVLKFLLVGDNDVDKDQIMRALRSDTQGERAQRYSGVEYKSTTLHFPGEKAKIHVWDTSGLGMFSYVYNNYARSADGIILVYDLLNKYSFKSLPSWIRQIRDQAPSVPIILVANNKHLEINRTVREKKARAFAKKEGMDYLEISGFCNYRVEETLSLLAKKAINRNAIRRFWTNVDNKVCTLEELSFRKVLDSLEPNSDIDSLPLTAPMKDALRLYIPTKETGQQRTFKFSRNVKRLFLRPCKQGNANTNNNSGSSGSSSSSNSSNSTHSSAHNHNNNNNHNSPQLPHDRIKPNRAYHHISSRHWIKMSSCFSM